MTVLTQVGEHLLSLVQELEAFASSDALSDLMSLSEPSHALTLLTTLSARSWKNLRTALDLKEEEDVESLCKRSLCAAAVTAAEKGMFGTQLSKIIEDQIVENTDNQGGKIRFLFVISSPPSVTRIILTLLRFISSFPASCSSTFQVSFHFILFCFIFFLLSSPSSLLFLT